MAQVYLDLLRYEPLCITVAAVDAFNTANAVPWMPCLGHTCWGQRAVDAVYPLPWTTGTPCIAVFVLAQVAAVYIIRLWLGLREPSGGDRASHLYHTPLAGTARAQRRRWERSGIRRRSRLVGTSPELKEEPLSARPLLRTHQSVL